MYDQKPTTSLMEDLQVLGLVKQKDDKPLTEAKGLEPDPTMAQGEPEAAAEKAPADSAAPAAPATPPFPSTGATIENKPKAEEPEKKEGEEEEEEEKDAAPDDEMAAYEAAWNVVKQYYSLNEKSEKLSEDDYRTVINAMSYIIETQGKYLTAEPDHDPDELPGGLNPKWAGNAENDPNEKVQGTNAMRKLKGYKYHDGSPRPSEKAESLTALVGELKALTQQTESDDEMQELGTKIIEGFEAIRDTADEVAQGLAAELRESAEKVTEDHPRVRLGKYFEGVSGDAKLLLKAISERETTDVDDAIEDLNSLARDLKRGLAQL